MLQADVQSDGSAAILWSNSGQLMLEGSWSRLRGNIALAATLCFHSAFSATLWLQLPKHPKFRPLKTKPFGLFPGQFMVSTVAKLWFQSHLPPIKRSKISGILNAGAHHLRRASTAQQEAGNGNH